MEANYLDSFGEELNTFERELLNRFEKHRETGSTWLPDDLKQMVFNAFECELKPERIIELTKAPSALVFRWHKSFLYEQTRKSKSSFREVRVVETPHLKKDPEKIKQESSSYTGSNITIKFPNQVKITLNSATIDFYLLEKIFALGKNGGKYAHEI